MLFMCVYVCVLFIFLAFQHFFFWGISSPSCAAAWKISSWPLKGRSWWLWTYSRIPTAFSTLRKPGFSRLVLPSINEKIIGIIYIYNIHVYFIYLINNINNPIYIYIYNHRYITIYIMQWPSQIGITTNHIYIYGRLGGLKDLGIGLPFHVSNVWNSPNCSWKTIDDFHHV